MVSKELNEPLTRLADRTATDDVIEFVIILLLIAIITSITLVRPETFNAYTLIILLIIVFAGGILFFRFIEKRDIRREENAKKQEKQNS